MRSSPPGTVGGGGRPGSVPGFGRTGRGIRGRRPLHVVPGDRAVRAAARQRGQADAEVLGQLAHRRLSQCWLGQCGSDRGSTARARRPPPAARRAPRAAVGTSAVSGRPAARPAGLRARGGGRGLDAVAHQDRVPFGLLGLRALGGQCSRRTRGREPRPVRHYRSRLARHLDRDDRDADLDGLALLGQQPGDRAVPRAGQLDHRLGGLDLHDDLAVLDLVARLDVPGDDVGLGQALAYVGKLELLELGHARPLSSRTCGRRRPGSGPGRAGSAPRAGTAGTGWRSRRPAAPAPRGGRSTAR